MFKALSSVICDGTLIVKAETPNGDKLIVISDYPSDTLDAVNFERSNLTMEQYDLLSPTEPDARVLQWIADGRNMFDSLATA
jgi:hypothetical protein